MSSPYIVNCTKSTLEAIRRAVRKAGGKTIIVSDDDYYAASDFIFSSDSDNSFEKNAMAAIRTNFMLRKRFRYHLKIQSCGEIAATAKALAKILPEFDDAYTLRKIMRERLPYSLHTETALTGSKAEAIIIKHGGKAEVTESE